MWDIATSGRSYLQVMTNGVLDITNSGLRVVSYNVGGTSAPAGQMVPVVLPSEMPNVMACPQKTEAAGFPQTSPNSKGKAAKVLQLPNELIQAMSGADVICLQEASTPKGWCGPLGGRPKGFVKLEDTSTSLASRLKEYDDGDGDGRVFASQSKQEKSESNRATGYLVTLWNTKHGDEHDVDDVNFAILCKGIPDDELKLAGDGDVEKLWQLIQNTFERRTLCVKLSGIHVINYHAPSKSKTRVDDLKTFSSLLNLLATHIPGFRAVCIGDMNHAASDMVVATLENEKSPNKLGSIRPSLVPVPQTPNEVYLGLDWAFTAHGAWVAADNTAMAKMRRLKNQCPVPNKLNYKNSSLNPICRTTTRW